MTLQLGGKCIKCLLIPFNLLFVITGIFLIIVGGVIKTPYSAYQCILDHGFFAIPVLLIFIGVITFLVSFFGFYGAWKEKYWMIIMFGVMLVLIFILEISGGIAGYVLRDKVSDALTDDLKSKIKFYNTSQDVKAMWDLAQTKFHCCGATNASDWNNTLPDSCCEKKPCTIKTAYENSCSDVLKSVFTSNAGTLGGAGIGIAIIQILGILFSYSLATSFRKNYETIGKD